MVVLKPPLVVFSIVALLFSTDTCSPYVKVLEGLAPLTDHVTVAEVYCDCADTLWMMPVGSGVGCGSGDSVGDGADGDGGGGVVGAGAAAEGFGVADGFGVELGGGPLIDMTPLLRPGSTPFILLSSPKPITAVPAPIAVKLMLKICAKPVSLEFREALKCILPLLSVMPGEPKDVPAVDLPVTLRRWAGYTTLPTIFWDVVLELMYALTSTVNDLFTDVEPGVWVITSWLPAS